MAVLESSVTCDEKRSTCSRNGQKLGTVTLGLSAAIAIWILTTGVWNDNGVRIDTDTWNDS